MSRPPLVQARFMTRPPTPGTSSPSPPSSASVPAPEHHGLLAGLSLWDRVQSSFSWFPSWRPTSAALLQQSEQKILEKEIKSSYQDHFVHVGRASVIRTIVLEPEMATNKDRVPLVMVHGFGAGFLQFYKNIDHLHRNRRLLAFDLPGFGRSTRTNFPKEPKRVESQFVDMIEKWRVEMGVEKFVLLGHSLGGYLATSYTIKHPERVRHLVLVDPWGIPKPPNMDAKMKEMSPFQRLSWKTLSGIRPFTAVRAIGPWGPDLIKRIRGDLVRIFGENFMDYIYHCNARNPTGEEAFFNMQYYFGWAKRPMIPRVSSQLDARVPITVIFGEKSWLDAINSRNKLKKTAYLIKEARPKGAYVNVAMVGGAGHHLHAEAPQEFNRIVQEVLDVVDSGEDGG